MVADDSFRFWFLSAGSRGRRQTSGVRAVMRRAVLDNVPIDVLERLGERGQEVVPKSAEKQVSDQLHMATPRIAKRRRSAGRRRDLRSAPVIRCLLRGNQSTLCHPAHLV